MVGDVQSKSLLEEPQADIVLPNGVQDQTNVGVDQRKLWVILPGHQESQVARSEGKVRMEFSPIVKEVLSLPVEQLEGSGDLSVGEAVEGEVGVLGDRVGVVDSWARRSL